MENFEQHLPVILMVALALSEALALIPALKSNSILQLCIAILQKLAPKKEAVKSEEPKKLE